MEQLLGFSCSCSGETVERNIRELLDKSDCKRAEFALRTAIETENGLNTCFCIKDKENHLKWCHLTGWKKEGDFLVLFSALTPEMQLFQEIAGETTDDIYVIGKETYHLLYAKEQKKIFSKEESQTGRK